MPTVIDSLVVTLGIDASKYTAGQEQASKSLKRTREEASRTAKDMQASGAQAAEFFGQIKNEAMGLIGVLVGGRGFETMVRNATNSMAGLGREARNIQIPVQQLAAFSNVVERNGGSAESARQSFAGLKQQLENWKVFGDPAVLRFLNPIGADVNDTPLGIFMKFMGFVQQHKGDAPLVNLIGKGLGFDQGLINAAIQMGSVAEAQRQLNDAMRDAPTQKQVDEAQKLQDAWYQVEQAAKGLRNEITTGLSPAMIGALKWTRDEIHENPQLIKDIAAIFGGLTAVAGVRIAAGAMGLTGLASALGGIVGFVERLAPWASLLLALHGDAGPKSDLKPGGEFFGQNGAVSRWWQSNMPTWLGGSPGPSKALAPPAAGSRAAGVMKQVHDFWISKGFTEEQVAGILAGGPGAESGFDPSRVGDNGSSYGLYQHHDVRMKALFAKYGPNPTVEQQNEFAWEELNDPQNRNLLRSLRASASARDAASVWTAGFERPRNTSAEVLRRGDAAGSFLPGAGAPAASAYVPPPSSQAAFPQISPNMSTDIHIGHVVVNTQATDAHGIARDLVPALVTQANRGLQ